MKAPITLRTKGRFKLFGWGEGNWDCATDAAGSMDISKGNSNFIVFLDSIWFGQVVAFGLVATLLGSLNDQHFGGFRCTTLGTPGATAGCDCAMDATGSMAMRKGIMNFIGSPLDSVWHRSVSWKEYNRTLFGQKKINLQRNTL